jgi:4-aminobutyrate aminotransferase / (S)-3-amino-2-methylpropionate transaminase / 5-aminovalerate transaminase
VSYIQLKTGLPGPKSQALQQRRQASVSSGLAQAHPAVIARGSGSLVEDVDGNTLVDLAGGIGALALGHTPSDVVSAVQKQTEKLLHMCSIVATYEPYIELCERLNELTPGTFAKKTLLANGGAEAVENAVKLARSFTGRQAVIVFEGAYHGRTNLTMAMTSKYALFKKGFGPFAPEVYRLPLPNTYRPAQGLTPEAWTEWCCWNLRNALTSHVDGSSLAAIVIEPVVGEGGFIPVPTAFLKCVREVCDETGAVMIADEIQSGSGRTGKLFAIEHSGVIPDVIISAKSLGAGMPISAVTGRADILDATHAGGVGSTYGGSPLACVAAIKALEHLSNPDFLKGAQTIERVVRETFEPLKITLCSVGDVRGVGGMMVLEFVVNRETKEPWASLATEVVTGSYRKGVIVIRAGLYSNCVRFLPALDIPETMLREALGVVASALHEAHESLA